MRKICIVAPFITLPGEPGLNRFWTIAKMLSDTYDVTLVTSRFCHFTKSHRLPIQQIDKVEIVLLDEPGYTKNVSLKRYYSHRQLCRNFKEFLKQTTYFDLFYSAFPLIQTNLDLGEHCQTHRSKLIIDVQDIWPDSITGPVPFLNKSPFKRLLRPLKDKADAALNYADALVAVSQTYLDKTNVKHLPASKTCCVYIGANSLFFNHDKDKAPFTAIYIGTMAGSYDLKTVVKASAGLKGIEIVFVGDGPDRVKLENFNRNIGGTVTFKNPVPYNELQNILQNADIAINPIVQTSQGSVTNKLSDYFCAGLPIVSCQNNNEVRQLLNKGGGVHYEPGNADDLALALGKVAGDHSKRKEMRAINQKIAKKLFYRPESYKKIIKLVDRQLDTK